MAQVLLGARQLMIILRMQFLFSGFLHRLRALYIGTSSDGTNWATQIFGSGDELFGIAYNSHKYVAVSRDVACFFSTDATNWMEFELDECYGIAFGNGRFVTVGDGSIYTSTNGTNWNREVLPVFSELFFAVACGEGLTVVVGQHGGNYILVSQLPKLGPIISSDDIVQFTVSGPVNAAIILESTKEFNVPNWRPIITNSLIGGVASFAESATNPACFYRVQIE
jgi:hypothetical protein